MSDSPPPPDCCTFISKEKEVQQSPTLKRGLQLRLRLNLLALCVTIIANAVVLLLDRRCVDGQFVGQTAEREAK